MDLGASKDFSAYVRKIDNVSMIQARRFPVCALKLNSPRVRLCFETDNNLMKHTR